MLMALQGQNQHRVHVEHPQCAALDTRWQHKHVERIRSCSSEFLATVLKVMAQIIFHCENVIM